MGDFDFAHLRVCEPVELEKILDELCTKGMSLEATAGGVVFTGDSKLNL